MEDIDKQLQLILGDNNFIKKEPMQRHTSFRVGGPADLFLTPESVEQAVQVLALLREAGIPEYVIGKGSNLLVSDGGLRGAVVQIGSKLCNSHFEGDRLIAEAGESLTSLAAKAAEAGMSGLEFASGIPGSLGGGLCMNAGAYGGEMKQVLESATVLHPDGAVRTLSCADLDMGYRRSRISDLKLVVLSAILQLHPGKQEEITKKMRGFHQQRREKQPLEYPSAGSTFKRPEGHFAGKLIEDAGLKGFRIGGAQVSSKHSGFLINAGGATAGDVYQLIRHCQKVVEEAFGIKLQTEVKLLGKFEA